MDNEAFLKSYVSGVEANFEMLKKLEEGRERGKVDTEFLAYCRGGINACEKVLDFVKDLNANEK
ncbi:hypothetical protein GCM10011409_35780 [Lentibacillus populi]|uniref:Uncharacterized protein n=1 Tax=Lentibacillus populi TaxID=1827502 RepID=A0A9W5TZY9_9BACI|nr:hypothetical protein [Lentibacillus populi]GGB54995.1 hypothetical protein GCM10011409_35780 [Lentibacillus populi]